MSRSTSRDHYSADDLDRTIEAVLAAASRVSVAPDGYTDPNWNTGNASQNNNHNNSSRNPSAGANNNSNHPQFGGNNNIGGGHQQYPYNNNGQNQYPYQNQQQQQQQQGYGNRSVLPHSAGNNSNYNNYNNQQQHQQPQNLYNYHHPENHVHNYNLVNNNNTNQYYNNNNINQPSRSDQFSQVTPLASGRPMNSSRQNQQQQQPLRPDDDVDAITEAVLQQGHPSNNVGSQPNSSRIPPQQQQQDNLDGTRNSGWQNNNNNQNNNQQLTSPNPPSARGQFGNNNNNNNKQQSQDPLSPGAALRKKQKAAAANSHSSPSAENGKDEKNKKKRTEEENESLRACNEFVVRRMELWQYKKDQERLKGDTERIDREMEGCTFQPDLDASRCAGSGGAGADMDRLLSPSSLYFGNQAWGFDSFVRRLEVARDRKVDKEIQDADAFRVKGPAAAKYRQGNHRATVADPFEFASGQGHSSKRLEHHLMTSGRTNVGGSPGGPSLVALRRGQPLLPHQGIRATEVEKIAEERARIRQETGATVPSGAFSQHGAWKDIANPM